MKSALTSPSRQIVSGVSLLALLTVAAAGCHDRLYDFGGAVNPVVKDAGADATRADTRTDRTPVDVRSDGTAGAGGSDAGGSGGGGTGGAAGQGGDGGTVMICDPKSPERQTDIANCGTCFNICIAPNSDPQCVGGSCVYTCQGGFFDADKKASNGCECVKTNGGVEACDGYDNDCNGMVDEKFDFQGDVDNCGGCNRRCAFPFALASCVAGACKQGACRAGYYDRDPN